MMLGMSHCDELYCCPVISCQGLHPRHYNPLAPAAGIRKDEPESKKQSQVKAGVEAKQWNACGLDKTRKAKAPDLNLPLQMEGVSTSRQAMEGSGGLLGGQVWSPMEWWWGQWRTGESGERKDPALSERQLALRAAHGPSSLALCWPQRRKCVCVSLSV